MLQTKALENQEPALLFTEPIDLEKLESAGIGFAVDDDRPIALRLPGRIGRGGRLMFDRSWNPLNRSPETKPFATAVHKDRPTWSSRQV